MLYVKKNKKYERQGREKEKKEITFDTIWKAVNVIIDVIQ